MSQWGAYGRARAGYSADEILSVYYGGTQPGRVGNDEVRVRLTGWDDVGSLGVISSNQLLRWRGVDQGDTTNYSSIYVEETSPNRFTIFGSTAAPQCGPEPQIELPEDDYSTTSPIATEVAGPIMFDLNGGDAQTAASGTLGICGVDGAVSHYRGSIEMIDTSDGNRVVNAVPVESYLRSVVPHEVPAWWGVPKGGIEALKAQAVAARSYGLTQRRYAYADTCDTPSCQVYRGAGRRTAATGTFTGQEHANTDGAIAATVGEVRIWPDGSLVSTEFSASNGPRTAGGTFPSVDDPYDNVEGNPYHTWTVTIPADEVAEAFNLSSTLQVRTEADPTSRYEGIWAHRVRLTDTRTVTALEFRHKFALRSHGFTVTPAFDGEPTPVAPTSAPEVHPSPTALASTAPSPEAPEMVAPSTAPSTIETPTASEPPTSARTTTTLPPATPATTAATTTTTIATTTTAATTTTTIATTTTATPSVETWPSASPSSAVPTTVAAVRTPSEPVAQGGSGASPDTTGLTTIETPDEPTHHTNPLRWVRRHWLRLLWLRVWLRSHRAIE